MRNCLSVACVVGVVMSSVPVQAGPLRESAERMAAERAAVQTGRRSAGRRSAAKTALGLGLIGAGAALMALQPKQPQQPGIVGREQLGDAAVDWFANNAPNDLAARRATGGVVLVCEPFCAGAIDEALTSAYVTGAAGGIVAASTVVDDRPWVLHDGAVAPYEEKSRGQLYGGLAAGAAGAIIATIWADAPAPVNFGLTPGGARIGKTLGF